MTVRTGFAAPQPEQPGISEVTLAHVYRAESARSTQWRTRLDTTTNWAITTTAALVSFSFSRLGPHTVLLMGTVIVLGFLGIEARRYRYYDLWARRARLIETGYLVPLLRREPVSEDFEAALAAELSRPRLRVSTVDALAFRLRRTYWPILALLNASWVLKVSVHPQPTRSLGELLQRAHIGPVPGAVVAAGWLLLALGVALLLVYSREAPLPPTELRASAQHTSALGDIFRTVGGRARVHVPTPPRVRPATEEQRLA